MNLLQASEYTGLSQSFISEVINGKRNMKKETLISFLEKMGYTYEQYENLAMPIWKTNEFRLSIFQFWAKSKSPLIYWAKGMLAITYPFSAFGSLCMALDAA